MVLEIAQNFEAHDGVIQKIVNRISKSQVLAERINKQVFFIIISFISFFTSDECTCQISFFFFFFLFKIVFIMVVMFNVVSNA